MNFVDYSNFCDLIPTDLQDGYDASADVIGECEGCGEELTAESPGYRDDEGNGFCSMDCAIEYYGIKKMGKEDAAWFRERRAAE